MHHEAAFLDDLAVGVQQPFGGTTLVFLPPYSSNLSPIERVFANLKTLLRKTKRRTVEATWRQIGSLLSVFSPRKCANYFRNSGYASV
jgi:transposase